MNVGPRFKPVTNEEPLVEEAKTALGIPPEPNSFSSWTELYAAACAKPGPKTIEIDDTAGPVILPPGTHDVSGFTFTGVKRASLRSPRR